MQSIQSKQDILDQLKKGSEEFISVCNTISDELFFRQPAEKWSIAQNVTHLVTSANRTRLAYQLPKFIVRLYTGQPNRSSRSYEQLVEKYKSKLAMGGKASGKFVAKPVDASRGKENILQTFYREMEKLVATMNNKWEDPQLDRYLAPHPLLGKITLRELGFFTIYHTEHHLAIIKERLNG